LARATRNRIRSTISRLPGTTLSKSVQLPWMGLGLSANLDARAVPNPWQLHNRHPDLFDFVEYSAPLALQEARSHAPLMATLEDQLGTLPAIFHPVHLNLHGPALENAK